MRPSDIQQTLDSARDLKGSGKNTNAESLLLAYVAWEGLKNRIVVCGLAQQGWQLNTFRQAIEGTTYWKSGSYNSAFKAVFGVEPHQAPGAGQIWKRARTAEKLRGKFVHGMGKNKPEVLEASFIFLEETITDLTWLQRLRVQLPNGEKEPLGNIFEVLRATRGLQVDQSVERLRVHLGLTNLKMD